VLPSIFDQPHLETYSITLALRVQVFKDKLNQINFWGCVVVFSGVVMYKIHFHISKQNRKNEVSDDSSSARLPSLHYRQVKDHHSDDGNPGSNHLDDLDDFLDEDNVILCENVVEMEMSRA
jgi:hypothetical protein